jgi:hypothetical protein
MAEVDTKLKLLHVTATAMVVMVIGIGSCKTAEACTTNLLILMTTRTDCQHSVQLLRTLPFPLVCPLVLQLKLQLKELFLLLRINLLRINLA